MPADIGRGTSWRLWLPTCQVRLTKRCLKASSHTSPTVHDPGGESAEAEPEAPSGKATCIKLPSWEGWSVDDHVGGEDLWMGEPSLSSSSRTVLRKLLELEGKSQHSWPELLPTPKPQDGAY